MSDQNEINQATNAGYEKIHGKPDYEPLDQHSYYRKCNELYAENVTLRAEVEKLKEQLKVAREAMIEVEEYDRACGALGSAEILLTAFALTKLNEMEAGE